MSSCLWSGIERGQHAWIAIALSAAGCACAVTQDTRPPARATANAGATGPQPTAATGEVVSQLAQAVFYVFHANDNVYWFGSDERGVYRYDGRTLVNYTIEDGLPSNQIRGIQEDRLGRVYFTTYAGISRFDGQAFTTLRVSATSAPTEWMLQPDDLWFVGPPDTGVVYRYDGRSLHRLELPRCKLGDEHVAAHPRSRFPNAIYSPYDVYSIFKDSRGSLWFGTAILGACRYDGESFAWLSESELHNGSFGTRSIVEDRDGRFWFCNALHRYEVDPSDPAGPRFKRLEGIRDADDPRALPPGGIMSSTVDDSGALWMATYGDGVWRYDGTDLAHYPVLDGDEPTTLFSISKDRQGGLWLGTHRSGVYRLEGRAFERFTP